MNPQYLSINSLILSPKTFIFPCISQKKAVPLGVERLG